MTAERAHVIHSVRFADAAKVFGLASGSGYLRGNGSGGLEEDDGSALTLPTPVPRSLLHFDAEGVLTAAVSPAITGTLTVGGLEFSASAEVTVDTVSAATFKGAFYDPDPSGGYLNVQLAGQLVDTSTPPANYLLVGSLSAPSSSEGGDYGESVALGRGSSAGSWGVALGRSAVTSGEGGVALGRLAKSRIEGTLRSTAPPIVSRGGAGESSGGGNTQGVLGSLRAFASSQVVLACEPISAIPTSGAGAVIVVPAGARFIPMVVLGWISELEGPAGLRGNILTPYIGSYAYVIRLGTTPPVLTTSSTVSGDYEYWLGSDDIFSLTLVKAGELGGLGDVTTAQFAAFGDRFQGLTGSIYVQAPPRSFLDGLTEVTPAFASVRVALVGILVEREESDA